MRVTPINDTAAAIALMDEQREKYRPKQPPIEIPEKSEIPHHTSMWELAGQWARAATDYHALRKYREATKSLKREGPVSLTVLNHRHACCHGETIDGVRVSDPCPFRYQTDRGFFCKVCKCPERELADLSIDVDEVMKPLEERTRYFKLEYPALFCEKNHFSAMQGVHSDGDQPLARR